MAHGCPLQAPLHHNSHSSLACIQKCQPVFVVPQLVLQAVLLAGVLMLKLQGLTALGTWILLYSDPCLPLSWLLGLGES